MTDQPVEILLVEDHEDDVVIIQEAFIESKMVNVSNTVSDGEAALSYLRREGTYRVVCRPNLVLLDFNMPRKNGFEVMEAIVADPRERSLPVIMLTMSDKEEDTLKGLPCTCC